MTAGSMACQFGRRAQVEVQHGNRPRRARLDGGKPAVGSRCRLTMTDAARRPGFWLSPSNKSCPTPYSAHLRVLEALDCQDQLTDEPPRL